MFKKKITAALFILIACLYAAYASGRCGRWIGTTDVNAKLCSDHGFGSKADNCVVCGKWVGSSKITAKLCGDHGFGSKADNCVICDKWVGSAKIYAKLCSDCGFGSKGANCAKIK
jgi:hypothetical protein